jgi:anti-anti-sigma factor
MLQIETDATKEAAAVRLIVRGQLDMTAGDAFTSALTDASRLGRPVELDLSRVDFLDGCGLSMLIELASQARLAGRELSICDASKCVCRLIEITETRESLPPLPIAAKRSKRQAAGLRESRRSGSSTGRWAFTR